MEKKGKRNRAPPGTHPNAIRAWRQKRGYSLQELVERMAAVDPPHITYTSKLSDVERGIMQYTQTMIEAAAKALDSYPADLIDMNPLSEDRSRLLTLVHQIKPDDEKTALKIIEALVAA